MCRWASYQSVAAPAGLPAAAPIMSYPVQIEGEHIKVNLG